jgi:methionine-rich copper-binding protein CopC
MTGGRAGRRAATLALALLALLAVWFGSPTPVLAHAELASTDPADGSSVEAMPRAVELRFTEGVRTPAAVTVVGPSGRAVTAGAPATLGKVLTQRLSRTTDGPGGYAVRFQVMSEDGHLVYGATTFTVAGGGPAGAAGLFDDGSGVTQPTVLLLGLALLALLGFAAAGLGRLVREQADG